MKKSGAAAMAVTDDIGEQSLLYIIGRGAED